MGSRSRSGSLEDECYIVDCCNEAWGSNYRSYAVGTAACTTIHICSFGQITTLSHHSRIPMTEITQIDTQVVANTLTPTGWLSHA